MKRSLLESYPDETWVADTSLSNFTSKAGSRHLSVASIKYFDDIGQDSGTLGMGDDVSSTALLLFENPSGAISALISVPLANRSDVGLDENFILYQDYWLDVTSDAVALQASPKHVAAPWRSTTLYESLESSGNNTKIPNEPFTPASGSNINTPGFAFGAPFTCENIASGTNLTAMAVFYGGHSYIGDPYDFDVSWLTTTFYTSLKNGSHGLFRSSR